MHYWFPAYEPAFAKFSVGIILLLRMLEAAAAQDVCTLDLGKGESQYKQRLMTGSIALSEGLARVPSIWGTASTVRERAEALHARGGIGKALLLPLKLVRRLERSYRFR